MFPLGYGKKCGEETHGCSRRLDIYHWWHVHDSVHDDLRIITVGKMMWLNLSTRQSMDNQSSIAHTLRGWQLNGMIKIARSRNLILCHLIFFIVSFE